MKLETYTLWLGHYPVEFNSFEGYHVSHRTMTQGATPKIFTDIDFAKGVAENLSRYGEITIESTTIEI
jgi:hypothetical protein